jgi:hypothetical protein
VVEVAYLYTAQAAVYQIRYSADTCWPGVSRVCQHRHTACFPNGLDRLVGFRLQARGVGRSVTNYGSLEGLFESLNTVAIGPQSITRRFVLWVDTDAQEMKVAPSSFCVYLYAGYNLQRRIRRCLLSLSYAFYCVVICDGDRRQPMLNSQVNDLRRRARAVGGSAMNM